MVQKGRCRGMSLFVFDRQGLLRQPQEGKEWTKTNKKNMTTVTFLGCFMSATIEIHSAILPLATGNLHAHGHFKMLHLLGSAIYFLGSPSTSLYYYPPGSLLIDVN